MRRNSERLAWTILSISLFVCVGLAIAIPLVIRSFINDSTEVASITLEVQQGTVLVQRVGIDQPIGVTTELNNVPEGSTIRADPNVQALLTIRTPGEQATLMTIQIYGSTNLDIIDARAPRFQQSTLPYQAHLTIDGGRVRVTVAGGLERPTDCQLVSPQATALLQEGSYVIEVTNDEAQVTVRDGLAQVSAHGSVLDLKPQQRTVVRLGSPPSGIFSPELNLITDGDFRQPLAMGWEVTHDLQEPSEAPGTVSIITDGGGRWALFERSGTYHAETDLRQIINKDVRGFGSLKLHFLVQISDHDVPVCGQAGSECPLMMRLDYKDANGTDRSYLQGFYWRLDPNNINPNYNTTSGQRVEHLRVQPNVPRPFDSDNLMTLLAPSQITAITFYASGHSWRAAISEVELLGEQ